MKKIFGLLGVFILLLNFNVNAQDTDNKWAFGVGANAIDHKNVNPLLDKPFDFSRWEFIAPLSRIWIARNLTKHLNAQISASIGNIDNQRFGQTDELFVDADLGLQLRTGLSEGIFKVFDPYLIGTVGYHKFEYSRGQNSSLAPEDGRFFTDDTDFITAAGGIGFNLWFWQKVGLNFQSQYKHALNGNDTYQDYIHHGFGLIFKFGAQDIDGDKVIDRKDECPEIPGEKEFNGCPDTDGDGIPDPKDECPGEPGLAQYNGCPDTDGDGIADPQDDCPNDAGSTATGGCPDADSDGIKDSDDKCPTEKGIAPHGCPDADGDGIFDKQDLCPNVKGTQPDGCPDTDGDGIKDNRDRCPKVYGESIDGCPKVKAPVIKTITAKEQEKLKSLAKTIYFETGKNAIKSSSKLKLDEIAAILKKYPNQQFAIEGHTDSVGSAANNKKLSQTRADSVLQYLISKGVDSAELTSIGYGEEKPIEDNKTKAGRAANRRVEIKLIK